MEPIIKDLNIEKTLLNPITFNETTISGITINKLFIRPVLKRIVFMTKELDRVIVYDGDADYDAHKNDSDEVLITALLDTIDKNYHI